MSDYWSITDGLFLTQPTYHGRNWIVDPFKNPVYTWFMALLPASVSVILLFLDQVSAARLYVIVFMHILAYLCRTSPV